MRRRALLAAMATLPLAGCGFQPLYGRARAVTPVGDSLNAVAIATIQDRSGQVLRNLLIDRMHIGGTPPVAPYLLSVALRERVIDLGIRKDAVATRGQIRFTASYALTRRVDGASLLSAGARSTASYNILPSEFGTTVTAEDARRRGLEVLANDIVTRLSAYFGRTDGPLG